MASDMDYKCIDAILYRTLEDSQNKRYKIVKQHIFCAFSNEHKFDLSEDGAFLANCDKRPYPTLHELFQLPVTSSDAPRAGLKDAAVSDKRLVPSQPDEPEFIPLSIPEFRINRILMAWKEQHQKHAPIVGQINLSDLIIAIFQFLPLLTTDSTIPDPSSPLVPALLFRAVHFGIQCSSTVVAHVFIKSQGLDIDQRGNIDRTPFPGDTIQQSIREKMWSVNDAKEIHHTSPDFTPVLIPKESIEKLLALDLESKSDDTTQGRAKACKIEIQAIVHDLFVTLNM